MMKKILLSIGLLLFACVSVNAQAPTSCFEIQSILADACGTVEGENEMVRFIVGPSALNTANLTVTWPNNPYRGICQNANTASKVAALNATIEGCGWLVEPTGGILPAGREVLLVTSEDINTSANSFTNLNDTLIIIFQCTGNTNGHFANYNSTAGIRTLIMNFSSPAGCTDTASYDRAQLINQNGGFGGGSALQDGGRIDYDFQGNPTYANSGCQAPFIPVTASAGPAMTTCDGDTVPLNGMAGGVYDSLRWTGGLGVFGNPLNDTTYYVPGPGETGSVSLTLNVFTECGDTVSSLMTITLNTSPTATITAGGPLTFCAGSSVTLTAAGANAITWNTGATTSSINASSTGFYFATATNSCGSDSAGLNVTVNPLPATAITAVDPVTFCAGDSAMLVATGADSYVWSTGSINDTIKVYTAGTYSVTGTNSCGNSTSSETITVLTAPVVTIAATGSTDLCPGATVTLTASGGGPAYTWSDNSTGSSIVVSTSGTYTASSSNQCGSSTSAPVTITSIDAPVATITGNTFFCSGSMTVLQGTGNGTLQWSTGSTASSINVLTTGVYTLTVSNSCGQDVESVTVTSSSVTAGFTASPLTGTAPLPVQFTNSSGNAVTYNWNFNDNSTSVEASPLHTFSSGGNYEVMLVALNSDGCQDTAILTITVIDPKSILIVPNVFSPNGDNVNDLFEIKNQSIVEFSIKIYDRWGILVHESTDVNHSWDGTTISGNKASDGTYYFLLTAKGADDENYKQEGFLSLFR